jgi:arginine decarboxylase-like protein
LRRTAHPDSALTYTAFQIDHPLLVSRDADAFRSLGGKLFPVMPIHRLNEEPRRRGIIGDISCDSDGKIDQFRDDVEAAIREGKVGYEEAGRLLKFYEDGMNGYTYLER